MDDSTHPPQTENLARKSWLVALFDRLATMYGGRFTMDFRSPEDIERWHQIWGESLASVTAEQMRHALEVTKQTCLERPPTLPQFIAFAKQTPAKVERPLLPAPHGERPGAERHIRRMWDVLKDKKEPGAWWADEVIAQAQAGIPTTIAAEEAARAVLAKRRQDETATD